VNRYEGIVEVQALSPARVNKWLAGGYQLLEIAVVNISGRHPVESSGPNAGAYFVRRSLRYVVGRTTDVVEIPWEQAATVPQDVGAKEQIADKVEP
jgi:hypothetical protein